MITVVFKDYGRNEIGTRAYYYFRLIEVSLNYQCYPFLKS